VPKVAPIVELVNGALTCSSKRVPPQSNGSILKVSFLQGHGFLVIIIKGFVLIMKLRSDQLLGMFVKKLSPMEKTHLLFVNHVHHRISSPINNANNILICLGTICHEPFENGCIQPFFFNNCVQLPPDNALCFNVLKLHVI
jgi:hypothetical protein